MWSDDSGLKPPEGCPSTGWGKIAASRCRTVGSSTSEARLPITRARMNAAIAFGRGILLVVVENEVGVMALRSGSIPRKVTKMPLRSSRITCTSRCSDLFTSAKLAMIRTPASKARASNVKISCKESIRHSLCE